MSVEASLLPSERIRNLAEKTVIAAVRKDDPRCEPLRKEFDARATGWVVVLDSRGELLDSGVADEKGALNKKDSAERFPRLLADRIEASLQRKESIQDLEGRWEKDAMEESGFESLATRLEEMKSDGRLRKACEKLAALPGLPADRRSGALLRAFTARSREYGALQTPEAHARFVEEGERLIADHAAHPRAPEALQSLFKSGYCGKFDVPARSAAGIARLEAMSRDLKDSGALRERIAELSRLREKEIEKLQASRAGAKGRESSEAWFAGALGDAETTIRVFSKPPFDTNAYYQAWVREAREKLRK